MIEPNLPEYADNPFIASLPQPLSPETALDKLTDLPAFHPDERSYPAYLRCHCVQRLGRYFDPISRHIALEARIGGLIRQGYIGRNPNTTDFIHRLHNNHARVVGRNLDVSLHPVETTASGIALIGCSGIGKSRSIDRILRLYPQTVQHDTPMALVQVPWLKLDCPHKGSAKQLCISFFNAMDRLLGTRFQARHGSARIALDEMVVHMAEIADRHALGLLVIDEVQHLMRAPGAGRDDLLNFLVTLINKIGLPVLLVGTPAALPILQGAFRQARRASGIGSAVWEPFPDDANWQAFVKRMWSWQWTKIETPIDSEILAALRDESQGIVDVVVKLYMLTQLRAIELGALGDREERIDAALIRRVAKQDLRLIAPMIEALRSGNQRALQLYDDLVPLADHVRQTLHNAAVRVEPISKSTSQEPLPALTAEIETLDDPTLKEMLEQMGLAPDIAALLISEVRRDFPDASSLSLVASISDRLQDRGPEAQPKQKHKRRTTKETQEVDPHDLRNIALQDGEDFHTAFVRSAAIREPLKDVG